MKYHYEKPNLYLAIFGDTYQCNHPLYDSCTLFKINSKGLAVIQQRCENKKTFWTEIDPWLIDDIYIHPLFKEYFDNRAGEQVEGLYPTVSVRQIMWALKIKPIKKERWETMFDRKEIWDVLFSTTIMKIKEDFILWYLYI